MNTTAGRAVSTDRGFSARGGDSIRPKRREEGIVNRVWLRLVLVVLAAYAVTSIGLMQAPRYEATALLLVGQKGRTLEYRVPPDPKLVMEAIDSCPVAEEAIRRLGLEMTPVALLENLTTEQIGSTQFMQFSYRATDPVKATKIANTVSGVFSEFASGRRSDLARIIHEGS
jgi:capsular polysaccharide biosynthesis protein